MDKEHRQLHSERRTPHREVRLCLHRLSSPRGDPNSDEARPRQHARQQLDRDRRANESDLQQSLLATSTDHEALQAKARKERTPAAIRTMRSSCELLQKSHVGIVEQSDV